MCICEVTIDPYVVLDLDVRRCGDIVPNLRLRSRHGHGPDSVKSIIVDENAVSSVAPRKDADHARRGDPVSHQVGVIEYVVVDKTLAMGRCSVHIDDVASPTDVAEDVIADDRISVGPTIA